MEFNEYQKKAKKTALNTPIKTNGRNIDFAYPLIGLVGETGEVAEKLKKHIRDNKAIDKDDLKKELGDILWYLATLATKLDIRLDDIATTNIEKLYSRYERGVIHGSGDNR